MAQSPDKLLSNLKVLLFDFDPDSADAVDISWQDFRDFERIVIFFFRTVGTGALDTFRLLANTGSTGGGTDVVVASHAVATEPNLLGDYIFLEANASMIAQEAADAGIANVRYVSANVEFATSTDEGVIGYIMEPRRAYDGLSADTIA